MLAIVSLATSSLMSISPADAARSPSAPTNWRGVLASKQLPKPPWRRRSSLRPGRPAPMSALAPRRAYPEEPATPSNIDAARFTKALNILCGTNTKLRRARHRMSARRAAQYSKLILQWSAHFGVDPYLVSSLIYRRSRCRARLVRENLVGLSLIDIAAHRRHVRSGQYRYYMLDGDNTWRLRELDVSKF
ncbi:MAG: hypothetical protein KC503_00965, partial [Myxococcales bacterium]|nr:hypothetical protein [Myxococcales bacterium]